MAVSRQGSGRAPGKDGLVAELLKVDASGAAKLIAPLFAKIHEQGVQPWLWRGGVLHELWKGFYSVRECRFYLGVFLVGVSAKCYHGFLRQRLVPYLSEYSPV